MKNKKVIIALIVSLLVIIVAVGLIKHKKSQLAKMKPAKVYPVIVKTIKPVKSSFQLTLTSLGIVKSSVDTMISTKLAARIITIKPLGSKVKKGDVIAKLDSSSTQAKLSGAKANLNALYAKLNSARINLNNMIKTHKRTKELFKVKGASIEQMQKEEGIIANLKANVSAIKENVKSAKSVVKELETLLSYTVIKSPINGTISKKFANVGDVAMPGRPLCEVSSEGQKYILIRLPKEIKPKGIIFNKHFYETTPLNGTFNGLNEYKADVDTNINTNSRIEISVVVFRGKGIKLPVDAILNRNSKNYVLVADGDRALPEEVDIASSGEEGVAVGDSNLIGRELVVAKPDILLKLTGGVAIKKEN